MIGERSVSVGRKKVACRVERDMFSKKSVTRAGNGDTVVALCTKDSITEMEEGASYRRAREF